MNGYQACVVRCVVLFQISVPMAVEFDEINKMKDTADENTCKASNSLMLEERKLNEVCKNSSPIPFANLYKY